MQTRRIDTKDATYITVWADDVAEPTRLNSYELTCANSDLDRSDKRLPPTARLSMLTPTARADFETIRRLAREYDYVADVAEQLQTEKRAAYARRYGEEA